VDCGFAGGSGGGAAGGVGRKIAPDLKIRGLKPWVPFGTLARRLKRRSFTVVRALPIVTKRDRKQRQVQRQRQRTGVSAPHDQNQQRRRSTIFPSLLLTQVALNCCRDAPAEADFMVIGVRFSDTDVFFRTHRAAVADERFYLVGVEILALTTAGWLLGTGYEAD